MRSFHQPTKRYVRSGGRSRGKQLCGLHTKALMLAKKNNKKKQLGDSGRWESRGLVPVLKFPRTRLVSLLRLVSENILESNQTVDSEMFARSQKTSSELTFR